MECNIPILSVKLKIPQPRKNYIIRKELFEKLKKIKNYKVTIVKAGAGSGKTTLLTSFIKETGSEEVKWITLNENANQIFVFWNYVIEAVKEYLEDEKDDFQAFFDSNMQKENLWQILSLFVNKLNIEKEIVLVLDDFQIVSDDFLIATIDYFIENMPDNVHLVLLTREIPDIYLGELAIEDRLMVIDEDSIRLMAEESRNFLIHTLKLVKAEEQIMSMIEASEGWIGGLQLLAIATKDRDTQLSGDFKLSNRLLNDYITKEIFEFLSKEEQEFLIETSILRYFNQEICQKYKPETSFQTMMESILQKNLFVINMDEVAGLYRYHAIMIEYMSFLFEKYDTKKRRQLHNLAAQIYYEEGDYEESLHHLFVIEEYENIMRLILKMPQTVLTFSYLMKVPMEQISKNPDFAYQYFFYYYASVDVEACERIYKFINTNMTADTTFEAFKHSDIFLGDYWAFDYEALNQSTKVLSLEQINELPLNSVTTAFLLIKEAYFLFAVSRYQEAVNYLNCAGEVYRQTGNIYIGYFVLAEKTQILEDMGNLKECLRLYKEMKTLILQCESLVCTYYIGIAGVYIKQLDLDKAFEILDQIKPFQITNNINRAYQYTLAEYYYTIGEDITTEKIIMDVMGQDAVHNICFSARLLRYPIYRGNHNELARQFAKDYETMDDINKNMDSDLLYISIQYENGYIQQAGELLEALIAVARKKQSKLKIVEGDLLKIRMMLSDQYDIRIIQNLFIEAVSYAVEDQIALPFWFEKETVKKVFAISNIEFKRELSADEFEFVSKILKSDGKHGIKGKIKYQADLTEREKEVLSELAKGSTNTQIAEQLCISLSTVKSHIINIYGKLGVNNRVAAVNKIGVGKGKL